MTARILVVDDILGNVRLLEAKLTAEYYDVITAMNGLDALETLERLPVDLLLLDVMMPGIDGIEVCRRLRSQASTMHLPIIMITALDQPEDRVRGLEAGADDFLTKPVNDISLFVRIENLLRRNERLGNLGSRSRPEYVEALRVLSTRRSSVEPNVVLVADSDFVVLDRLVETHPQINIKKLLGPHREEFLDECVRADVVLLDDSANSFDPLRTISQIKAFDSSAQVLLICDPSKHATLLRALKMGVDDYMQLPLYKEEISARIFNCAWKRKYAQLVEIGNFQEDADSLSLADQNDSAGVDPKTISDLATPSPFLGKDNRIDAGPDAYFDHPNKDSSIGEIVGLQRTLVVTLLRGLPNQCPRSLVPALENYSDQLHENSKGLLTDVVKCMFQIIRADIEAQSAEDEWLTEGTKKAFELFSSNHFALIARFSTSDQKDNVFEKININEEIASGGKITKPIENLRLSIVGASESQIFTENFVRIVDSMVKHAQAISSHSGLVVSKVESSTAAKVSPKKRFVLSTIGFAERTYNLIGTSAGLMGFAASPQGQAVLLRLSEIISMFSKFII